MTQQEQQRAAAFIPYAEEGFLLTLTSKGIYNRSRKDYEALCSRAALISGAALGGGAVISFDGENPAIDLGEARVVLKEPVKDSVCSCPSQGICKHILMSLFAVKDALHAENGPEPAVAATDNTAEKFSCLLHADLSALKKEAGKKLFTEALEETEDGNGAVFPSPEVDPLPAELPVYGITVYFPARNSIQGSVCKCGSRDLCKHKLIAIFSFLQERELPLPEVDAPEDAAARETERSLLKNARTALTELLKKGLISAGPLEISRLEQLSLKCGSLGNLSRLFRSLAGDLENMTAKSAAFVPSRAFATLSRLYTSVSLLQSLPVEEKEKRSLIAGKSRAVYRSIPWGNFTGLGAWPWLTRSGFAGVSCLVFHRERNALLSYTTALPDFYEKTHDASSPARLKAAYKTAEHWDPPAAMEQISQSLFTLRNGKISGEGRISSSNGTKYATLGKTTLVGVAEIAAALENSRIEDAGGYVYFSKRSTADFRFVFAMAISGCTYRQTSQDLSFVLETGSGGVPALIPYSPVNITAIHFIESLARYSGRDSFAPCWFICEERGGLLVPLSLADEEGIRNFYFS